MLGTVKHFDNQRGFGFIQPDDGGKDIFVHATAMHRAGLDALVAGDRVEFDIVPGNEPGRTKADKLRLLDDASADGSPVQYGAA
jgi:CspA family cold shock protein